MIKKITQKHYQQLIKDADIIEKDAFGVKVLDTKKGEMIKLFRRKRLLSTALFKPYAVRFVDNSKKITALGIPTITVNKLFWCSSIKRHLVIYQRLEGELLRDVLSKPSSNAKEIFRQFGAFIAQLHDKGIYFRSAHLKNILVLANGEFGLIDISDLMVKSHSLNVKLRQRNFKHILRYREDKALFKSHLQDFFSSYVTASNLGENETGKIEKTIKTILA